MVRNELRRYFRRCVTHRAGFFTVRLFWDFSETFLRKNWDKNGTLLVLTFLFSSDIMNISERSEFKIKELMSIERTQFVQK